MDANRDRLTHVSHNTKLFFLLPVFLCYEANCKSHQFIPRPHRFMGEKHVCWIHYSVYWIYQN